MLYIEDFLELIEPFPQELREKLTEMREFDLKIQNETDKLDERIKSFFNQCKKQKPEWKNENGEEIKKEYIKILENADDKIQIANQLFDLIEKYLKKLDQELQKFKLELEADHAGITSRLEQELSSKTFNENISLNKINSYSNLSLTFNNLNNQTVDDSDFTLCPSSSNDLMQLMLSTKANFESTIQSNHKRKHSNISEKSSGILNPSTLCRDDDDSSSSWNSSNMNNVSFNLNRKNSSTTINLNKRAISSSIRQTSNPETNFASVVNSFGSSFKKVNSISTKQKKAKSDKNRLKKIKNIDYDDENFDIEDSIPNDAYQTDEETNDGTNETQSEITSSENGVNTMEYDEEDRLGGTEDEDDDHSSFESENKFKIPQKSTRGNFANDRQTKDEWNHTEDSNERYCICKDISYGDMIMCDNSS
ncbi:Inhibitor of growth 3, partial [Brachionus plicatilis]